MGQANHDVSSWLEIEDIMAAKHAHKRKITEFKYGGCIRLSESEM